MGKRLDVSKKKSVPKPNLRRLRNPTAGQLKLLGVLLPLFCYGFVIGASLIVKQQSIAYLLGGWLVLGLFLILILSVSHKGKLSKTYPRSRVMGSSYPEVRHSLARLAKLLDLKKIPDTFIIDSQQVAALARGIGSPYVVISKRLLEVLTPQEFEALLAVVMGHVKTGNVPWRTFISALREAHPVIKVLCYPYNFCTMLMGSFMEESHQSADRVALVLLNGDYHLLMRTLIKVVSRTSDNLTEEQAKWLDAFLLQSSFEARAEDVERQVILGQVVRQVPGLEDRLAAIKNAPSLPAFQEELDIMRQRAEGLQVAPAGR